MTPLAPATNRRFIRSLRVLLVMILGLMALGAGVRTMNAGLSCPDWPLCFGKVIPDFHVGVWFEFVHRAYAGLVAIVFFGCLVYALRSKTVPNSTKRAAVAGLLFLILQIVMGGLTVLLLVKSVIVTMHLMLATFFLASVFWMHETMREADRFERSKSEAPVSISVLTKVIPVLVLLQIALGGLVASTYAGSVCVDWPLCNGQWVPTWTGAIGLQILHRFLAYFLAVTIPVFALWTLSRRREPWFTPALTRALWSSVLVVMMQVLIGIANLLLYIPPSLTVAHQSVALVLLLITLHQYFLVRATLTSESPAVDRAPRFETRPTPHTTL